MLGESIKGGEAPLLLTQFVLQIPTIVMLPSIEEVNSHVKTVIKNLMEVHKGIVMWGQKYTRRKENNELEMKNTIGNNSE